MTATAGRPARVVLALDKLRERHTGLERFSLYLARSVAAACPSGFETAFLAPEDRRTELPAGAVVLPIGRRFRSKWPWLPSLGRPGYPAALWHALAQDAKYWPPDPRTPMVLTIHDLNVLRMKRGRALAATLRRFQRNIDRSAAIVTVSRFVAGEVQQHLRVGGKRIAVIPHGLTMDTEGPAERPAGVGGAPFLLAVGRVVENKNLHAVVRMLGELPDREFLIAGDRSARYAEELERRIAGAGLSDRVRLLGPVSDAERLWLYRNAEAVVQPSVSEGFGLPVLEAMACGTPVFLARGTSLPEVAGSLGLYWDSFEPDAMAGVYRRGMAGLATEAEYHNRLRAHAAGFTWAKAAEEYWRVYQAVAEGRQGPKPETPRAPQS